MGDSSNIVEYNGPAADEEYEAEVARYEHALMTLIDTIRCSNPDQIETLLNFLRSKDTVAEAMEEVLQLKFLSGLGSG